MASRAGWNGFAGRIWPAGRSLETTGANYAACRADGPKLFVRSPVAWLRCPPTPATLLTLERVSRLSTSALVAWLAWAIPCEKGACHLSERECFCACPSRFWFQLPAELTLQRKLGRSWVRARFSIVENFSSGAVLNWKNFLPRWESAIAPC